MIRTTTQHIIPPSKPRIMACDPSFTAWGWVVMEGHQLVKAGVIVTKPEAKKRKLRESDDRARRVREIVSELARLIKDYNISFIVSEQPHFSQNAKSAIMIGAVVGILESFNVLRNIPLEWYLEEDAKKALLGRKSATKDQIKDAVDQLYETRWSGVGYADEAVADALAIYYAAECNSPTIKFMNR